MSISARTLVAGAISALLGVSATVVPLAPAAAQARFDVRVAPYGYGYAPYYYNPNYLPYPSYTWPPRNFYPQPY